MEKDLYPIGVIPKKIWLAKRREELKQAIIRYLNEWYEELEDLIRSM